MAASGRRDAGWYGLNQYLFWTMTDSLQGGVRCEWFNDQNGSRISDRGAHWHELTLGLNWTPHPNIRIRPEVRWDWVDFHDIAGEAAPFDNSTRRSQFLGAWT